VNDVPTNDVLTLARPDILELQPYQHAAWNPALERMHANEMPWRATGDDSDAGLNRYPEPQPRVLIERLAQLYDVPVRRILAGRGSDEAIDLLVRAFCRAGQDQVVICPPTFGYYAVAARIQGAAVREVPLLPADFGLDVAAVIDAGRRSKLVFLCSPNNPTGQLLDEAAILEVCRALAGTALVVLDEAYIEFATRKSLAPRLTEFPNLVVLRTLSKAYALAGARCGALLASDSIVGLLARILPPYALPASSVEAVLRLTAEPQHRQAQARIETLRAERERMRARLKALPGVRRILPSDANFLLVEFAAPRTALAAACAAGLLVRDLSAHPRLPGCLRLTIGTPEQNERLVTALERT
jgi:histidinol-phosphate aminotransferase